MQVTTNTDISPITKDVIDFYEHNADELDACHPEAFDIIYDIINRRPDDMMLRQILSDFNFEYGDELEGCNEVAHESLLTILKKYDIV